MGNYLTRAGFAIFVLFAPLVAAQNRAQEAGQAYPGRPIRVIIPFTGGSAADILARAIGPKMAENWGQQVVVDNRPGAGGTVAGEIVARATPDGHTLMLTSSALAGSAALYPKLPFDTMKDFAGITQIASTPLVLVVPTTLGAKSVRELVALAQKTPGQINFASAGIGSGTHYAGELFKLAAKIDVVHVPYKGTPEALTDTIAGRVHYMLAPPLTALPLVKSGRLSPLAVTTAQRMPALPNVPTVAEAGLPGFEYDGWFGVFAPGRISRTIVDRVNSEVGRILAFSDVRDRILSLGATPKSSTPEALSTLVRTEIETRRKIFAAAGARPE
jgi:tripartite-type tricarboxylate transporter receptor subunit TctC